jgi:hypothetical protein
MVGSSFASTTNSPVVLAAGIFGLLGLVFLILFFTVGQPFGTLNDICIGVVAILSAVIAWKTYPAYHTQAPLLSLAGMLFVCFGALIVVAGSVLVIFGFTGWFLAGLYMAAGYGLIGLWLLGLNYTASRGYGWPHNLIILGLLSGVVMALGLTTIPGIVRGIDSMESAPWVVSYICQAGALGYLLLYPIWCVLMGWVVIYK